MKIYFVLALCLSLFGMACSGNGTEPKKETESEPAFCDCVNKDYHKEGDQEKCEEIERELTQKLDNASQEEKGEILMKIQDCKVQGQYDND